MKKSITINNRQIQLLKVFFILSSAIIIIIILFLGKNDFKYNNIGEYIGKDISKIILNENDFICTIKVCDDITWKIYESRDYHLQIAIQESDIIAIYLKSDSLEGINILIDSLTDEYYSIKGERVNSEYYIDTKKNKVCSVLSFDSTNTKLSTHLYNEQESYVKQLFYLINYERMNEEISKLNYNIVNSSVANEYSQLLNESNLFSHIDSQGNTAIDRLNENNTKDYTLAGENLVRGERMLSFNAHNKIMNSIGHKNNVISKYFTEISIGYSNINDSIVICQIYMRQ